MNFNYSRAVVVQFWFKKDNHLNLISKTLVSHPGTPSIQYTFVDNDLHYHTKQKGGGKTEGPNCYVLCTLLYDD